MTYHEKRIAEEYNRFSMAALREGISRTEYLQKNLHAMIDRMEEKDLRVIWYFTRRFREGGDHQ